MLSGIVYCLDTFNGETWNYDSYYDYYKEMSPLLVRTGLNIKASINKGA